MLSTVADLVFNNQWPGTNIYAVAPPILASLENTLKKNIHFSQYFA
jgi:hypothetical protein